MKRLLSIFALVALVSGCTATRSASPANAEERRLQDGKLLYEVGRIDDARSRLEFVLAPTSDERLRAGASYYLDRIAEGLAPELGDLGVPQCFAP